MDDTKKVVVPKKILLYFILVTSLFALWGFANDITNPMVAAFQTLMEISNAKAAMVQFAFYGGYATMALPAGLIIKKYGYKNGILIGLLLAGIGSLFFIPAAKYQVFEYFLISFYILTFGLAFLETTANPYILSMGPNETATRRLTLAQSFNPIGSLAGMLVASNFILAKLDSEKRDETGKLIFSTLSESGKAAIREHDLNIISYPYIIFGIVIFCIFIFMLLSKMPLQGSENNTINFKNSVKRLLNNKQYREGVIAQIFYVGAQIMCWTFIIQYADNLGISKVKAQYYNIAAMGSFMSIAFISSVWLMKFINPRILLLIYAIGAMFTTIGVIFIHGIMGLYMLVAVSAFMSIMFPTIYGIALEKLGDDTPLGSSGLIMAIVGGALLPPIQGAIIDLGKIGWLSAVNFSFILPLISFFIVAIYGFRSLKTDEHIMYRKKTFIKI